MFSGLSLFSSTGSCCSACSGAEQAGSCRLTCTLVPTPSTLCKLKVPPINSARVRLMTRPRPAPWRARGPSAWTKALNSRAWSAGLMPMPVSRTFSSTARLSVSLGEGSSRLAWTSPRSVNLMALLIRLDKTCLSRSGSASTQTGAAGSSLCKCRPLARALPSNTRTVARTSSTRLVGTGCRVMCPDSMREMSRISPISSSRPMAESWAVCKVWVSQRPPRLSSRANSSRPITAFIGVRISWLMVARKVLLVWLACSASSLAWRSCSSRPRLSASCACRACWASVRWLISLRR
ncbi:hypothetical protein D3C79_702940 [compost metagenome]